MNITFNELISIIHKRSLDEKEEIKLIIEKNIAEERRDEIHKNLLKSKIEAKNGKLKYSDDRSDLMRMVD